MSITVPSDIEAFDANIIHAVEHNLFDGDVVECLGNIDRFHPWPLIVNAKMDFFYDPVYIVRIKELGIFCLTIEVVTSSGRVLCIYADEEKCILDAHEGEPEPPMWKTPALALAA